MSGNTVSAPRELIGAPKQDAGCDGQKHPYHVKISEACLGQSQGMLLVEVMSNLNLEGIERTRWRGRRGTYRPRKPNPGRESRDLPRAASNSIRLEGPYGAGGQLWGYVGDQWAREVSRHQILTGLWELYSKLEGSHLLKVLDKERHGQINVLARSLRLRSE